MRESPEQPNFHEVAEERKVLRKALGELRTEIRDKVAPELLEEVEEKAGRFKIADHGGFSGAKDALRKDREKSDDKTWLDDEFIKEEVGEVYGDIARLRDEIRDLQEFEFRRLRDSTGNPQAVKTHKSLILTIQEERKGLEEQLSDIEREYPTESRAVTLSEYARHLHEVGHIAHTPSVGQAIRDIEMRMISGRPMFLHGPTGTGKTSLARLAASHLTGSEAEMIYCNPQTRETNIHGKERIRPAGKDNASIETFFDWGPLARAMKDGKVVVFDEFTALPKEQMSMIKGIMSAKVGDRAPVTGNGQVEITPGFQMIFTANLKSEKNPERQDIPPEVANEFDQNNLHIDYTPKEEAYDIMLARLMNTDGSVDLSYHDITITLPKLSEAFHEIQVAYTGVAEEETARLTGTMDASGKRPGLKKLVMNQRTVEAILTDWRTERTRQSDANFTEFLDQRLKMSLTFREYPETDRVLAAKILASKGFLLTLDAKELGLPSNTFSFDAAKKMREDKSGVRSLLEKSGEVRSLPLMEVAELDPFGLRQRDMREVAGEFIEPEEDPVDRESSNLDSESLKLKYKPFLDQTFGTWYNNGNPLDIDKVPQIVPSREQDWQALKNDIDNTKAGEYTLNPEAQGLNFEGMKVFIPDLSSFNGKQLAEVAEHLISTYSATHIIPGLEYWQWLIENPDKSPEELKDGKYNFFFGSTLRDQGGRWRVPYAGWNGSEWHRSARWLDGAWIGDDCVVLLEK